MIQKRASLHERTVQAVARGEVANPRARRRQRTDRSGRVSVTQQHPALSLAHRLGIPSENVQIVGEPPFWEAIFWNHAAPWPSSESEQES
jgi:hypothetical protein